MNLLKYQIDLSNRCAETICNLNICYLVAEMRIGKTLTALKTAQNLDFRSVLFITKKDAIPSIRSDYDAMDFDFNLTIINNESLHKVDGVFDFIISDEHHRNGSFIKGRPNKGTKLIKQKYSHLPMLFLSGTPHPESYSQVFHQFWVSDFSPFEERNFYKWAKTYVDIKDRHLGYGVVKVYSKGKRSLIMPKISPYIVTFTQEQGGFKTKVEETVLEVTMNEVTYAIANRLKKDKFVKNKKGDLILADTAVKEMQKLHQIYSGTVIFEGGSAKVFDLSKAVFIKDYFNGKKIGIFYKFKAELKAIQTVFGLENICQNLHEFDTTHKNIALQIVSGSEGISLKNADYLVYYNIDFSSKNYWQSRARMATRERLKNEIFWIFSKGGIEHKIYESVLQKKNYTLSIFKKNYGISKRNNKTV